MDASEARADGRDAGVDEVESLRRALEEEKQRTLRLLAEFDNFRKRASREQAAAQDQGRRAALMPLLPVLDSLEQAIAAGSSDHAFFEGVVATHRMFINALRQAGAEPIESLGAPFDAHIHEVVAAVASDEVEPGTIVREVRRGWRFGNELLRPAQVEIATRAGSDGPWQ